MGSEMCIRDSFSTDKVESARNFANKIWNASRFVLMNMGDEAETLEGKTLCAADQWILTRLNDTIRDDAVEGLVACMKKYGIEAFTFSSTWSSAVETAWLFQKAGCTLSGLIEINSQHKAFMSDEYEKAHGYLFKLN